MAETTPSSYLTADQARTLGASLTGVYPGLDRLMAISSDDTLSALLVMASIDIDHAMNYAGAKYGTDQALAFPRWRPHATPFPGTIISPTPIGNVWDWDKATNTAVVPYQVKVCCLLQAAWLMDSGNQARLDAIQSGLASHSTGSISETYTAGVLGGGLCDRAQRIMGHYRFQSGELL